VDVVILPLAGEAEAAGFTNDTQNEKMLRDLKNVLSNFLESKTRPTGGIASSHAHRASPALFNPDFVSVEVAP
jgi:hypothetical protein